MSKKGDRAKGNRIQNEFNKLLLDHGFITNPCGQAVHWWFDPKTGQRKPFSSKVDHWEGRFDNEAIHPDRPELTFLFQISVVWKTGKDRARLESFPHSNFRYICMVRRQSRKSFELSFFNYFNLNEGWGKSLSFEEFLSRFNFKISKNENIITS